LTGLIIGALCAGAAAAVAFARDWHHTEPAAKLVSKAGVAAAFDDEAVDWLLGPKPRFAGCGPGLVLLLVAAGLAVYASGFLLAAVITVVAFYGGAMAGMRRGVIGLALAGMAAEARRRGEQFRTTGDLERAESATRLADWVTQLHRRRPALTMRELKAYRTPGEIADILEGWFFQGTDAFELQRWLDEPPALVAWEGAEEQSRVTLLAAVRRELLAGGGKRYRDSERVAELVRQLRAWRGAA
jgi:hypothetical protein